jgi:hypothetical protein
MAVWTHGVLLLVPKPTDREHAAKNSIHQSKARIDAVGATCLVATVAAPNIVLTRMKSQGRLACVPAQSVP